MKFSSSVSIFMQVCLTDFTSSPGKLKLRFLPRGRSGCKMQCPWLSWFFGTGHSWCRCGLESREKSLHVLLRASWKAAVCPGSSSPTCCTKDRWHQPTNFRVSSYNKNLYDRESQVGGCVCLGLITITHSIIPSDYCTVKYTTRFRKMLYETQLFRHKRT